MKFSDVFFNESELRMKFTDIAFLVLFSILCFFLSGGDSQGACRTCHGGHCQAANLVVDATIQAIPPLPAESTILANRTKPVPPAPSPVVAPVATPCGPSVQIPAAPAGDGRGCGPAERREPLRRIVRGVWKLRPGLIFRRQ